MNIKKSDTATLVQHHIEKACSLCQMHKQQLNSLQLAILKDKGDTGIAKASALNSTTTNR